MTQDLRWNFLLLQRNTLCGVALTYEGFVLGSLGKITFHAPLLHVHDTDSCTWFHLLFTKSLSDFCFITPTIQTRKSSIEKKFAWSHLAFWKLIGINILNHYVYYLFSSVQSLSCVRLFANPMNCNSPGLPVHNQLPEFTQTHVHRVSDTIQPSHPLLPLSPPAFNLSEHQGLFQWVNSSHEVAKVLEFQL